MTFTCVSTFLRRALLADAASSAAMGVMLLSAAGALAALLRLPEMLLVGAGIILLPYAALVGYCGLRETLPRALVRAVIVANALWAVDSIALLLGGWIAPNALGEAFVVAQAVIVALFAELQYVGLRKSPMPAIA